MIIYKEGDLLKSNCTTIMHQANCFSVMGGGIAKSIANKFPKAYKVDKENTSSAKERLGSFSLAHRSVNQRFTIVNLYGQYDFGPGLKTNYNMLEDSINSFFYYAKSNDVDTTRVGVPYNMGCGLAGGDWEIVKEILNRQSVKHSIDIYVYKI